MPQQLHLALLTDPGNVLQAGVQPLLAAQLLVIRHGKTVRLVAHALQQKQGRRVVRKDDRVLAARAVELLVAVPPLAARLVHLQAALGNADHVQFAQSQFLQNTHRHAQLPLAAVHHEQVRQVVLQQRPPVAAAQHLQHHAVVVRPVQGTDAVAPVALLVRLTVHEAHHRPHRLRAADVGNVEALDAARQRLQAQALLQVFQSPLLLFLGVLLLFVRQPRVCHGQSHQMLLVALLRHAHEHLATLLLAEQFGQRVGVLQVARQQHFAGDVGIGGVVLVDERAQHLGLRRQLAGERIGAAANELAAAHIERLDLHRIAGPVIAENVLVALLQQVHALLAHRLFHRLQALVQPPRFFKSQVVGGPADLGLQGLDQLVALALQMQHHLPHQISIVRRRGEALYARRHALADLVIEARAGTAVEHRVRARADGEHAVQAAQRLAHRLAGGVRPEVQRLVRAGAPHHRQARIRLLRVEPQVNVVLVVAQVDVEARLVLLDEGVFEDEGFFLGVGDQEVDVHHRGQAEADMKARVAALRVVLSHPAAQVLGLADIDDLAVGVLHQIHARRAREAFDLGADIRHGASPTRCFSTPVPAPAGQKSDRATRRRARIRNARQPISSPCAAC